MSLQKETAREFKSTGRSQDIRKPQQPMATIAKKAAAMRTQSEVRTQLKKARVDLEEMRASFHAERKKYWHEDIQDAVRLGLLPVKEDGTVSVGLGFKGAKEAAFLKCHFEWIAQLQTQIETLEWVLGKEW